jgi:hypothetical protein
LLPLVPVAMISGIATFMMGHVAPLLGSLFGSVTAIIADIFLYGVELFSALDPVVTLQISLTTMTVMYLAILLYVKRNTT